MAIKGESSLAAKRAALGNYLKMYFNKNQGVRIGETAVVSRRLHKKSPRVFPHIQILIELDAGQVFSKCTEPNRAVHIDVYHEPAQIKAVPLARRIWAAINKYLEEESDRFRQSETDELLQPSDVAGRIRLATAEAQGTVARLVGQGYDDYTEIPEDLSDHVHLVMELPESWYGLVLDLIEVTEDAIYEQGYQIRKIMGISHGFKKGVQMEKSAVLVCPFSWQKDKDQTDNVIRVQNQKQAIMALARRLGSVEEVEDLLDSMRGNLLQRISNQAAAEKAGNLDALIDQMADAGLVDKGLLGPTLTEEGEELQNYLVGNKQEMEALLREFCGNSRKALNATNGLPRLSLNQEARKD